MIAEIHVSPSPSGTETNRYQHVEAAIAVVQERGLAYEVTALGTTFEGDADTVWATLRAAHEAVLASGADGVITSIRLGDRASEPTTMQALTAKFR
ncbi:MAG: MTH1187 family thiamine-binding protein [Acidimicrobiales bacterium]